MRIQYFDFFFFLHLHILQTVNEPLTAVNELTSIIYRAPLAIDKVRIINFKISLSLFLFLPYILRNNHWQHNIPEEKYI